MTNQHILITGGAGFIGCNAAAYFLGKKNRVTVLDNFSRVGSRENLKWLKRLYKQNLRVITHDVRDFNTKLKRVVGEADVVLHLAGQVAVTTSVANPREDFEINALGTLNLLEAARLSSLAPIFLYASTNKVYGDLASHRVQEGKSRYSFRSLPFGVNEVEPLDFHSPYGCSKGAADQYVRDYSRIYGLRTVVFRQSCIYGPHQFGVEDQGWLAWFMIRTLQEKPITIYGTGKQVRDVLYVDDLLRAYESAISKINTTCGQIYNLGGGKDNSISVWYDFKDILEGLFGRKLVAQSMPQRPGDQPIFIADIRKAYRDFGWRPKVGYKQGIGLLYTWITDNQSLFLTV